VGARLAQVTRLEPAHRQQLHLQVHQPFQPTAVGVVGQPMEVKKQVEQAVLVVVAVMAVQAARLRAVIQIAVVVVQPVATFQQAVAVAQLVAVRMEAAQTVAMAVLV
jgi:hypothetical protein